MRPRSAGAGLAIALLTIAGCASRPPATTRYWLLESCAANAQASVTVPRDGGKANVTVPRQSCEAVDTAARRIQAEAKFRLSRILIADSDALNAFATLDRDRKPVAVITLGILVAVGADEDAWAGLLGHEIAHHVRRHREAREGAITTSAMTGQAVANVIAIAIPGIGGLLGGTVGGSLAQSATFGAYTRPQEAEADDDALKWMASAGYDPRGLLRLFQVLGRSSSTPAFLSTHPATDDRIKAVEKFIAARPPA
jgi:predicted Zn-dependent protease